MPDTTADVAARFVSLVLGSDWGKLWADRETLSEEQVQILLETVAAAGFEPKSVVLGKLRGDYRDQDGRTSETFPVNSTCPYKVTDQDGRDHFYATGWLDCLVRHALSDRQNPRIEAVRVEIERSVPMEPIQLTPEGDMLLEYPPSTGGFVDHTRDDKKLSFCVGVHAYCHGWVDRNRASKTHDAIVCRRCYLRVPFPIEIETYGELRQHLEEKLA